MDFFDAEGTWWLPGRQAEAVAGKLIFDPDGLKLTTYGSLHAVEALEPGGLTPLEPVWVTEPLVFGTLRDRRDISLINARGGYLPDLPAAEETYRPELALIGGHVSRAEFSEARFEIDHLADWMDSPPLTKRQGRDTSLSTQTAELMETETGDSTVKVILGAHGRVSEDSVHLDQYCMFTVSTETPMDWQSMLAEQVRPLHDLMVLALGRPLAMNSFYLRPADGEKPPLCEAYFDTLRSKKTTGLIRNYAAPTLLLGSDSSIDLAELVTSWFHFRRRFEAVLLPLLNPFFAPFTYSEHRFVSIFQALEALHQEKDLYDSTDVTKEQHKRRVAAVIETFGQAGLEEETLGWAKSVLLGRNDKPLKQRVQEVVDSTGRMGEVILERDPQFAKSVASARSALSHGGGKSPLTPVALHWHGEVLLWVMRARLLAELGVPDVYERALVKAPFVFAVEQIG
ncbi:ApeA N-terminal domain 1-containing protein [Streptomyces albogriseolus]